MKKVHNIKLRYLNKKLWYDCDTVLEHTSFEILCRFIDKECSPGIVNWDNVYHNIEGKEIHVITKLREIKDWWIRRNNKPYKRLKKIVNKIKKKLRKKYNAKEVSSIPNGNGFYRVVFAYELMNKEDKEKYVRCDNILTRLDNLDIKKVEKNLIILAKLRRYMWT